MPIPWKQIWLYAQHPSHTPVQLCVNTLQICQRDFLLQDHLVEADDKVRIQEPPMEDCKTDTTPNELEIVQMLWVNTRRRVDLQRVIVMRRVFEEAVEWVEHLVREKEEEFSANEVISLVSHVNLMSRDTTYLETPP